MMQDSVNSRIREVRQNQDELKRNATRTLSMQELRQENAQLRNDVLSTSEDLKNVMKELENMTKNFN